MLDLVPQRAVDSADINDRVVQVRHKDIDDVSLYEKFGQIRRVPIEAQTTRPYRDDGIDFEMVEPVPVAVLSRFAEQGDGGAAQRPASR